MIQGRVSVIIAGRTEKYFKQTVDSVLESATGDIEVVAVVDGDEIEPFVESDDPRVKIIRLKKSIGQRAGYNLGVKESTGEYVMKIDAHALLSKGFDNGLKDVILSCGSNTTVLPEMRRLDVEKWEPKKGGETLFMFPGLDLYCHYWPQYKERDKSKEIYPETMTGQGSCWFCRREWSDYIGLLDEKVGSWGNVGIEISLRTYLCGGSQRVHPGVWQAHYFRKDEGGFPYPMNGRKVHKAHRYTWNNYYFKDDAFEHQCKPFKSYIEKFAPVPGWETYLTDEYKSPRYIVYYTDSKLDEKLARAVRKQLKKVCGLIPIVCVSQKPVNFGDIKVVLGERPRNYYSVYEALLAGIDACPSEAIIYPCEHDVFYHPSHFAFKPPAKGTMYFNLNRYYYHNKCNNYVNTRGKRAMSQCVAFKEDIKIHIRERINSMNVIDGKPNKDMIRWDDWERQSDIKCNNYTSERPNVDILHGDNFTFKGIYKKRYIAGKIKGVKNLPGWGRYKHFQSKTGYKRAA